MISWCARAEDVWCVSEWLSQTEMEPGLSALLGQMDPQSSTTVNTACFMSPAVLIFLTRFNSSPYNIRFSKAGVTVSNFFWNLSCAVVLWRGEVSGKRGEDFFIYLFIYFLVISGGHKVRFSKAAKVCHTTHHLSQPHSATRQMPRGPVA